MTAQRSKKISAYAEIKQRRHHYGNREKEAWQTAQTQGYGVRGYDLRNANNLSVIGIYPAKKSNRNQKNNAQKESIGLCKKRIDKMEMPTKSK